MNKIFIFLSYLGFVVVPVIGQTPAAYLSNRILKNNGRYETFHELLRLMNERNCKVVVEAGTARCGDTNFAGDGGSTIIFGHWADDHGVPFYSVDNCERHIEIARAVVEPYYCTTRFILSDSVVFLASFDSEIDCLYLDSFDYHEDDPLPPQLHCLKEIQAAYDKLTDRAIVAIDDCNVPGGGKGKLAIQWLLDRGWRLQRNRHQVILVRK
jgi:predicted O-methyltransferase YrrM